MKTTNIVTARALTVILALSLAQFAQVSPVQAAAAESSAYSQAELDQMLAPIALYPDSVLSHVLIAATYPLEVIQAARWSRANPGLEGEYAVAAVEYEPWDPSVMALVAFPELLARMDADLDWTQRLGNAFLIQEYQVMDTVQYLRDRAYASGHLRSNEYVRVVRETEYIYIEPSVSRVVYVPWYDPYVVYGNWRWSGHPPVYWHQPRGYHSGFSFHWGGGHRLEYGFFFSAFNWPGHSVVVHDHYGYHKRHDKHYHRRYGKHGYAGPRFGSGRELAHHKGARRWRHDPEHRRGVAYGRGMDDRRAIRTSDRATRTERNHGRDNGPANRLEQLRQRSRNSNVQTQRSVREPSGSSSRNRHSAKRTVRSRNSNKRDANSVLDVARRKSAASHQRRNHATERSSRSPRNASDRRRAAPDGASIRHKLTPRRTAHGKPRTKRNVQKISPDRDRNAQTRSSTRKSLSRPSPRASSLSNSRPKSRPKSQSNSQSTSKPISRSRSAPPRRAAKSRARPSAGSSRTVTRGSDRQATSPRARLRAGNGAKQERSSSRSIRAGTPRQKRPGGASNRSKISRSRGRDQGR